MKKDNFYSNTALVLSLGFWVPLFNIGFTVVAIFLAVKSLKLAEKEPGKYGGRNKAVIALVISVATLIMTLIGGGVYLYRRITHPECIF